MAYTYDDFLSAANQSNMLGRFTTQDLEITKNSPEYGLSMLRLMQDEDKATSEEAKMLTKSAMGQLRKNYGVMEGVEAFQYDRENDPNYQAFRKSYLRESDRAVDDAIAAAASATGGVPSSYAVTAATQAGHYYASQLADKEIQLEQNAYARHQNDVAAYLKKIAQQNALSGTDAGAPVVDSNQILLDLITKYPDKIVKDAQDWTVALNTFGADALNTFGITYQDPELVDDGNKGWFDRITQYADKFATGAQKWKDALNNFGSDVLESLGIESKVEKQTRELLETMYPAGIVTDAALWEKLKREYGPVKLYEWGFHEPVEGNQAGETKFRPTEKDRIMLVK